MVGKRTATKAVTRLIGGTEGIEGPHERSLESHRYGGRSIRPTATTSITITTASASTAVKVTTSEAAGTGYPRLGFVHRETTPVVILIMESLDRCLSLGVRVHLNEAEPLAAARVLVEDDLGVCTVPNGVNHPCRSEEVAE